MLCSEGERLFGSEESAAGAFRADANPNLAQAPGAVTFIGGSGSVAVDSLVGTTAFEKHADITAVASPVRGYFGLGDFAARSRPCTFLAVNLQNIVGVIRHIVQNLKRAVRGGHNYISYCK